MGMIDLHDLYERVTDVIWDYDIDYHTRYSYGNEWFAPDGSCVTFDVYAHSDQGEGHDWTEFWSIYSDGSIHADGEIYNGLEDFKNRWG